jgi:hypothetical protein
MPRQKISLRFEGDLSLCSFTVFLEGDAGVDPDCNASRASIMMTAPKLQMKYFLGTVF